MDTRQMSEALGLYIRPQTSPLAIRLCRSQSELPEGAQAPLRDLGYQVTLCQAYGIARIHGWTLALSNDDQLCVGGAVALGFAAEVPQGLPFPPIPAERRLEVGTYSHVVMAPLETVTFEPEVLAIWGNPAQVCRLVQAALWKGQPFSTNIAQPAACGAIVARTVTSDECQFILSCGGDRFYAGEQDHELVFTIPWGKVDAVLKGLEDTRKMGFGGYPTPVGITQRPTLPSMLEVPRAA